MTSGSSSYLREQIELHCRLARVYRERRYAPRYSRIFQEHWNRSLTELLGLDPGSAVLDYGSGTGILIPELMEQGYRVIALDLSLAMLAMTPAAAREALLVCADGARAPIPDESLDGIVCRGSIHHLQDLEGVLTEIARLLRPGGVLVFSEPSNDALPIRMARRLLYHLHRDFHEKDEGLRRATVTWLLERTGFELEVSRGFGFFGYTLAGFPDKLGVLRWVPGRCMITRGFIRLDRWLESMPAIATLALHWQVRARKRRHAPA
jgi:SAM-dependent methyltransferase